MLIPNWKEELLEEENRETVKKEMPMSPTIKINIEGKAIQALVDTGSTVTALAEDFYHQNVELFPNLPTLPLANTFVIGATGGKSSRLKKQIWAEITFKTIKRKGILLIVPNLVQTLILGMDWLMALQAVMDFRDHELQIKIGEITESMELKGIEDENYGEITETETKI
ncbi:hypothetical protein KPH14_007501 [Odynerus spinipes]|uniref:Peptidase A2 domain-containing protein n=1 Tax=Odynerus spinipes TaxID=1348599 RepID=A0AAD9VIT3_9HYME|nr:hypothetical protein KPH14_007501 [Odynerus spinipes]